MIDFSQRKRRRQIAKRLLAASLPRRLFMMHGPVDGGCVCLTFDDGPHPEYTPRLLDLLSTLGVSATFFLIGREAERFPSLVRRIADSGHVLGNHTFEHLDAMTTSCGLFLTDVNRSRNLLRQISGQSVNLFRPPHGRLTIAKLWGLWRSHHNVVLWNVDSRDYSRPGPNEILTAFTERPLRAGDLVLFHDNRSHCLSVLPSVIQEVRERGLTFITTLKWIDQT